MAISQVLSFRSVAACRVAPVYLNGRHYCPTRYLLNVPALQQQRVWGSGSNLKSATRNLLCRYQQCSGFRLVSNVIISLEPFLMKYNGQTLTNTEDERNKEKKL